MSVLPRPAKMSTEAINLNSSQPPTSGEVVACKFVVVAKDNHYALIFGDVRVYPYHANLLEKYCQDRLVAAHWIKRPDQYQVEDAHYRVLGGGYLELDHARHKIRISGSSKAYGFFDSEAVRLITASEPFFTDYTVTIEV